MVKRQSYLFIVVLVTLFLVNACSRKNRKVEPRLIKPSTYGDIIRFEDSLIKPLDYGKLLSLDKLPVNQRKRVFIDQLLPSILTCKYNLELIKKRVIWLHNKKRKLKRTEQLFLDSLMIRYRTNTVEDLILRISTHPSSLVIAQAALESAWGTSRFYKEGNNVFGIWSFNESEKRIPSRGLRNGKPVYLKKYDSLMESVEDYFLLLAKGPYNDFRMKRSETDNPLEISIYLSNYSELGKDYSRKINQIIKKNKLKEFDHYRLDLN